MNEYLNFNKMITPTIIKIIFWAGVIVSVLAALIMMIAGASSDYGGGFLTLGGLVILILGPFLTRIYCELLIVLFKMNEALQSIKKSSSSHI
jgi:hypothetical protein